MVIMKVTKSIIMACDMFRYQVTKSVIMVCDMFRYQALFNPLNAELNPICHLLALLGAHHILHVSRIRVKMQSNT